MANAMRCKGRFRPKPAFPGFSVARPGKSLRVTAMKHLEIRRIHRRIAVFPALAGVAILLFSLVLMVGPARAAERDRIEAFLEVTGFDVALDSIALSAGAAPKMLGLDPGVSGRNGPAEQGRFDTAQMREMALDILVPALGDDALTHAAGFYATDLGSAGRGGESRAHGRGR